MNHIALQMEYQSKPCTTAVNHTKKNHWIMSFLSIGLKLSIEIKQIPKGLIEDGDFSYFVQAAMRFRRRWR